MTTTFPPIDALPETSRVWVYPIQRPLSLEEERVVVERTAQFLSQWAAHGQQLHATYDIFYHQFLVIAVDEAQQMATGCSIDASVHMVNQLEQQLGLLFTDRSQVAFLKGENVVSYPFNRIKELVKEEEISPTDEMLNTAVATVGDWKGVGFCGQRTPG